MSAVAPRDDVRHSVIFSLLGTSRPAVLGSGVCMGGCTLIIHEYQWGEWLSTPSAQPAQQTLAPNTPFSKPMVLCTLCFDLSVKF